MCVIVVVGLFLVCCACLRSIRMGVLALKGSQTGFPLPFSVLPFFSSVPGAGCSSYIAICVRQGLRCLALLSPKVSGINRQIGACGLADVEYLVD